MEKEILDILKEMQSDMKTIKSDMKTMQGDIKTAQGDIKSIKSTQEEHTQILRALEHKTDVLSAKQENLEHEAAEVKGEVKGMRKDLCNVETITASNWSDLARLKVIK